MKMDKKTEDECREILKRFKRLKRELEEQPEGHEQNGRAGKVLFLKYFLLGHLVFYNSKKFKKIRDNC